MGSQQVYNVKHFNLSGLNGISDRTTEMHFKLYEGYVKATNSLNERISELLEGKAVDEKRLPDYFGLTRRLGFETNGMVLHEHYFGNLKKDGGGDPEKSAPFRVAAEQSFGSYENWKKDFVALSKMRGVGWTITFHDPSNQRLSNYWVEEHQLGNIAGYSPILVMDVWEHAYLLDYAPVDRPKYVDAFFSNIDWAAVGKRLPAVSKSQSVEAKPGNVLVGAR